MALVVENKEKMRPSYENLNFLAERPYKILQLCSFLTPILNKLHGLDFSEKFWARVLGFYARTCINRTNCLRQATEKYEIPFVEVNGWYPLTRRQINQYKLLYYLKAFRYRGSVHKFKNMASKCDNFCLGLRGKELENIRVGVYVDTINSVFLVADKRKRKELVKIANNEKDVFKRNVLLQMPRVYVEYLNDFLKKVPIIDDIHKKVFHMEHLVSVFMNIMVASYAEQGAGVYEYQLGGVIGETTDSIDPLKYFIIDKHFTYGWKIHAKDEPFYAIRLESFRKQVEKCSEIQRYDAIVVYSVILEDRVRVRYKMLSEHLFSAINFSKYQQIVLRPRGQSRKFDNSKELSFLDVPKSLSVDKGKRPLAELVAQSGLVIHFDHPSTNFLECIYIDHPVVALLTNPAPTEIVKRFYESFLSVGVMHKDLDSLIKHINKIDVDTWWSGVVQMEFYKEFKHTFARSPEALQ